MKPKDFKPLFPKKSPQVIFQDLFFALPRRAASPFKLPAFHEIFGNNNPVSIEYCSGNGHWIVERAKAFADQNFIAVEWQFDRARKIFSKKENEQLKNLLVVCAEASRFTKEHVPSDSISQVFVHFPDPWPKRRHIKHRLMQGSFLQEVARVLSLKGELTLVTDDWDYMSFSLDNLHQTSGLKPIFEEPFYQTLQAYGTSTFEELWKELGRNFYKCTFQKQELRPLVACENENVCCQVIDCSSRSSLKWTIAAQDKPVLWHLQTDLFDGPSNEMAIRSFELAIDHFIETVLPHHKSFGVLLFKGRGPVDAPLLRSLAARFPDDLPLYLAIDLTGYTQSDFFFALKREELTHFKFILKGAENPYATEALGWAEPSPWGVFEGNESLLLPEKPLQKALCYGQQANFVLPKEPLRVIPEALLSDEWHGLNTLVITQLSMQGRRQVAGFAATGGEIITYTDD